MSVSNCQLMNRLHMQQYFPQPVYTFLIGRLDRTISRIHLDVNRNEFIQTRNALFTSRPKRIDRLLPCLRVFIIRKQDRSYRVPSDCCAIDIRVSR